MPNHQSETSVYTREFSDDKRCTAKKAKEVFFLDAADLSELPFERERGYGAYAFGTGACKYFNVNDVRDMAVEKFGCVEKLMSKAVARNLRKSNKAEKDELKRLEEQQRRQTAAAFAEKARIAAAEVKKQAALERKRKANEVVRDAESWRKLVITFGSDAIEPADIEKLIADAKSWKEHCVSTSQEKKRKIMESSTENLPPNSSLKVE
jgi:flagellar biosynthesis GTPase FlhF